MHTVDTIKSVKPPIRETSFVEPSSDFDNNCSLDSYLGMRRFCRHNF